MRMRILLAAHHFPPTYTGGVELVAQRAAKWLAEHGCTVDVLCVEEISSNIDVIQSRREDKDGYGIIRLSLPKPTGENKFSWSYRHPLVGKWVKNYLEQHPKDIVHLLSGYLLTGSVLQVAGNLSIPAVVSLTDYWFFCPRITLFTPAGKICDGGEPRKCAWCLKTEQRRYRYLDLLTGGRFGSMVVHQNRNTWMSRLLGMSGWVTQNAERREVNQKLLSEVDAIIAHSIYLRDLVLQEGYDERRVHLIPHGMDLLVKPEPPKQLNGELRIGYFGNIIPIKGLHLLVEAFTRLQTKDSKISLIIYGDDHKDVRYTQVVRSIAITDERIIFKGKYLPHQVGDLLAEVDLVVVPSLWYEVYPLVIQEALAANKPVIVPGNQNLRLIIKDGVNGLNYIPNDVNDLAAKIQKVIDHPELLERLREGIEPVRSVEEEMQDWIKVYEKVTASRTGAAQ